MLHPDIVVKKSSLDGKGLFAKKPIPKGTLLWVLTGRDHIYTPRQYKKLSQAYRKNIDKYVYFQNGKLVFLTDNAKYWNHSCNPNASHFWKIGMDIALRDIKRGEEITYDYALLLAPTEKLLCKCGAKNCRRIIKHESPNSKIAKKLNRIARDAAKEIKNVRQPLLYIIKNNHVNIVVLKKW